MRSETKISPLRSAGSQAGLTGGPYDVERIRADFPILFREVHGRPLVYLDNGASAQKPHSVLEAMDHAYRFEYANVHRGLHHLSNVATEHYEAARETVRRFLNAEHSDEIIFTRNATSAINLVARSFGEPRIAAATKFSSRSWSTTPTSYPGISCASGKARFWRGRR